MDGRRLEAAIDGLGVVWYPKRRRPARSADAGLELARAVVEYFGKDPIDKLLTSDIALRDAAIAIVRQHELKS